jgi:hypothetical protein
LKVLFFAQHFCSENLSLMGGDLTRRLSASILRWTDDHATNQVPRFHDANTIKRRLSCDGDPLWLWRREQFCDDIAR